MTGQSRIMVVDDDVDFLDQVGLYLGSRGYEVRTADSRPAGERLLAEYDPDLVILDLMMENEDDGFVLARRIKSALPDVPVILVTAVTRETGIEFERAEDSHRWIRADRILPKPIRYEQLEREISVLLGRRTR